MNQKDKTTKIWVGVEDLTNSPEFIQAQEQEFLDLSKPENMAAEQDAQGLGRRDFLKYVGFGLGAATVAGCEIPVKKAIPYLVKPEEIVPGVANYYASAFVKGGDFLPVLVKTREGRPIKIEGNPNSPLTKGGTSARAQASVLELYDTNRLKGPAKIANGEAEAITWEALDAAVKAALSADAQVRIVSHTNLSPTLKAAVQAFTAEYPNTRWVQYDPFSCSALIEANERMFKKALVPNYRFDQAKTIVSIDADFLGTWISPTEYAKDYIKNRRLLDINEEGKVGVTKGHPVEITKGADKVMSHHVHFESRMSLTGSNADNRVLVKPSEQGAAVGLLYNEVASLLGKGTVSVPSANFAWEKAAKAIKVAAKALVEAKEKGLVVCGVNDVNVQMLVNGINQMLGAYGSTILWEEASLQRQGRDAGIKKLVDDLNGGQVSALFILDANPAFDIPGLAAKFAEGVAKAKLSVSFNASVDDTTALCQYAAPDHHILESWGDAQPKVGHYYLIQPTIRPLFNTRAAGHSFLTWAGVAPRGEQPYYEYLKNIWRNTIFQQHGKYASFQAFWDNALHDGFVQVKGAAAPKADGEDVVEEGGNADLSSAAANLPKPSGSGMEISFYETVNMGSGQYANNPWLQEMPDPIMRTTWDNFLSIPIKWDGDNNYLSLANLQDGDIASITINGTAYKLPVIRQFGQLQGTLSIGLGYGRQRAGKAGSKIGTDFFPVVSASGNNFQYHAAADGEPAKAGKAPIFASVQMHHTYGLKNKMEGSDKLINVDEQVLGHRGFQGSLTNRSVVFESSAAELEKGIAHLKEKRKEYQHLNEKGLYPGHKDWYEMGHHWAMAVDLNACIGCGACTVACMAENNVPVVGKYEVSVAHEMTWLRIDRYYYGTEETPNTVYQPMMCQHCENAPCENVCPVAATNHSSEGLNQMTYNRCIGTRYCANNCPYKVRRFNWLDYTAADLFPANEVDMNRDIQGAEYYTYMTDNLTRMVLNPDVTVRSRGVIEKCSFCVQRIQEGKLKAKVEGRKLQDGDVKSACQQACPTGAIVFGDRNDKTSEVWKLMNTKRAYLALEETNVGSAVTYMMKVTNRKDEYNA